MLRVVVRLLAQALHQGGKHALLLREVDDLIRVRSFRVLLVFLVLVWAVVFFGGRLGYGLRRRVWDGRLGRRLRAVPGGVLRFILRLLLRDGLLYAGKGDNFSAPVPAAELRQDFLQVVVRRFRAPDQVLDVDKLCIAFTVLIVGHYGDPLRKAEDRLPGSYYSRSR